MLAPKPHEVDEAVVLYVTSYCGFCRMAEALLDRLAVPYRALDVTSDPGARSWLVANTGRRTVPQIFIGGRPIGGYQELRSLHAKGELEALVQTVAAGG